MAYSIMLLIEKLNPYNPNMGRGFFVLKECEFQAKAVISTRSKLQIIMIALFLIIFSIISCKPVQDTNEYYVHNFPVQSYAGQIPLRRLDSNSSAQMFFW